MTCKCRSSSGVQHTDRSRGCKNRLWVWRAPDHGAARGDGDRRIWQRHHYILLWSVQLTIVAGSKNRILCSNRRLFRSLIWWMIICRNCNNVLGDKHETSFLFSGHSQGISHDLNSAKDTYSQAITLSQPHGYPSYVLCWYLQISVQVLCMCMWNLCFSTNSKPTNLDNMMRVVVQSCSAYENMFSVDLTTPRFMTPVLLLMSLIHKYLGWEDGAYKHEHHI